MPTLRSNRTEIADRLKNTESPIQALTHRSMNLCSKLVLVLCLVSLVGCQTSRKIGARNSGASDDGAISLWGNQRQSQTADDSLHFANDAGTDDESTADRQASVFEESTAEAASNSSWGRIFDRFRPTQHSSELPRTDVKDEDKALDESTSFDSGF
jgi:hypothetical protein